MNWILDLVKDWDSVVKVLFGVFVCLLIVGFAIKKIKNDYENEARKAREQEAKLKELEGLKDNFHNEVEMARAKALEEAAALRAKLAEETERRRSLEESAVSGHLELQNQHVAQLHVASSEPVVAAHDDGRPTMDEVKSIMEVMSAPLPVEEVVEPVVETPAIVAHAAVAPVAAATVVPRLSALHEAIIAAGFKEGVDFDMNIHGADAWIRLQNGGLVAIDATAPRELYDDAAKTIDPELRDTKFKAHGDRILRHVEKLGATQWATKPDFIVAYAASESIFQTAVDHDGRLMDACDKASVSLAGPTSLVAILRSVAKVAKSGGATVDKDALEMLHAGAHSFAARVARLGSELRKANESYHEVVGSMDRDLLAPVRSVTGKASPAMDHEVQRVELMPDLRFERASGE